MRMRNSKDQEMVINNCSFLIKEPNKYKGNYKSLFNNNNPINLEIGMGKGKFIYEMAKTFPHINFIGLEKFDNVISKAIKNFDQVLPNLLLIKVDALKLNEIFDHEIDTIYLNFSDPWPKKRQNKRRLTHPNFLKVYDNIFKEKKHIIMKTDNIDLFADSIVYLSNYGYILNDISLDLHNKEIFNIKTEYEEKFSNKGFKINYLDATKD